MAGTVVQQVKLLPVVSACSMAAAPLPVQLPTNQPGKAAHCPRTWDSETQVGDPDEARGYRGPLWSKPTDGRPLSIFVTLPFNTIFKSFFF